MSPARHDIDSLPPKARLRLAHAWGWRAREEARAANLFDYVAREIGSRDADLAAWAARSAEQERAHATWCATYAATFGPSPDALGPADEQHLQPAVDDAVLLGFVVAACCINETLAAGYLREMRRRARTPTARRLVRDLLRDEVEHARFGWIYLARRTALEDIRGWLDANLVSILVCSMGVVFEESHVAAADDDDAVSELVSAHGYLSACDGRRSYLDSFDQAILPGFRALGVELGDVEAWRSQLAVSGS
jgi:hypothetical protein